MKIAFSVTGPDLARVLADIARRARAASGALPRPAAGSTVSPAARQALAARPEASDGES